jgi:hypothetical protein
MLQVHDVLWAHVATRGSPTDPKISMPCLLNTGSHHSEVLPAIKAFGAFYTPRVS